MSKDSNFENSLYFVSKYFKPGIFSKRRKRDDLETIIGKRNPFILWANPRRIVAASITIALVASASCILYFKYVDQNQTPQQVTATEPVLHTEPTPVEKVNYAVIDYEDVPLNEVVDDIERIYGVKITNIPDKKYNLTLHFEGEASDLISLINELLGTNLQIEDNKNLQLKE